MRHSLLVLSIVALVGAGWPGVSRPAARSNGDLGAPLAGFGIQALPRAGTIPGWLSLAPSSKELLYISGGVSSSVVSIFDQKTSQRVGEITQGLDGAFGLFVDKQRNLYVTNVINGTVAVYAPGATSPFETLTGARAPLSVVVRRDGTVFVANLGNINNSSHGTVLEYLKGQTTPSKTVVAFGDKTAPTGVALDSADNLYVAYNVARSPSFKEDGAVLEFSPSSPSGKKLGIHVGHTAAITVDKNNNLVLVDQGKASYFPPAVDVYRPGHTKPFKKFLAHGCPGIGVSLNRANTEIWAVCPWQGTALRLTYPAGQLIETIAPHGWVFGVATSPDGTE